MNAKVKPLIERLLHMTWVYVQDHEMDEANDLVSNRLARRGWSNRQLTITSDKARIKLQSLVEPPAIEHDDDDEITVPLYIEVADGETQGVATPQEFEDYFKALRVATYQNSSDIYGDTFKAISGITIEEAAASDIDNGEYIRRTRMALMAVMFIVKDFDVRYNIIQALRPGLSYLNTEEMIEFALAAHDMAKLL